LTVLTALQQKQFLTTEFTEYTEGRMFKIE
jgi:hypothetical protein